MQTYIPRSVCSRKINFEVENNVITKCEFVGGCTGNTQGISRLVVGMSVSDAIDRLSGIQCRNGTSCPDQLARALKQFKEQ